MSHLYLMTRLYNTMDKRRACELERVILKGGSVHTTYMPYRDSDEDHIKGDWKEEIFKRDIREIEKADILVGYWDGPAFDEGVGFEIGYGIAKGKSVIIVNDDFLSYGGDDSTSSLRFPDPLVQALGIAVTGRIFSMSAVSTYEDDLCSTANLTYQEVAQRIIDMPVAKRMPPVVGSERRHEGFVDPGSSRILRSVLNKWAKQRNYLVARRFTETGNFLLAIQDIRDALTSRMVFVVSSGAEMTLGSSILCGLCYGFGVPFCVIDDRSMVPYSMTNVEMRTNLMIDVCCSGYLSLQDIEC